MIAIDTGPNTGATTLLEFSPGPGQPNLMAGDHIRIFRQVDQQGATSYGFYDYERAWPLAMLAAVFAIVIVAVARWRGLRALVGIVVAFVVLVVFMLPALRDGAPAVPVALVASAAILFCGDLSGARGEPAHQRGTAGNADRDVAGRRDCPGPQSNSRISPDCRRIRTTRWPPTWATSRSRDCCWPASSSDHSVCSTT